MDEHTGRTLRCLLICVAMILCTLISVLGLYNYYTFKEAIAKGLVVRTLPGVQGVHWGQPDGRTEK